MALSTDRLDPFFHTRFSIRITVSVTKSRTSARSLSRVKARFGEFRPWKRHPVNSLWRVLIKTRALRFNQVHCGERSSSPWFFFHLFPLPFVISKRRLYSNSRRMNLIVDLTKCSTKRARDVENGNGNEFSVRGKKVETTTEMFNRKARRCERK